MGQVKKLIARVCAHTHPTSSICLSLMDDLQYDEFGNYIGQDEEEELNIELEDEYGSEEEIGALEEDEVEEEEEDEEQLVAQVRERLAEAHNQVFGPDVETLVENYDTESLEKPLVKPSTNGHGPSFVEKPRGPTQQYRIDLMSQPNQVYNIAIAGQLLHGKTSLIDTLVAQGPLAAEDESTLAFIRKELRYTDNQAIERKKGLSVHATPVSLLLENSRGKTSLFNFVDTPGHPDFGDEIVVAANMADSMIIVIDTVEGLQLTAKRAIDTAVARNMPLIFLLNKLDRLILEMRLPPSEMLYKLEAVVDEIDRYVFSVSGKHPSMFSNFIFGSTEMGWFFTLASIATRYRVPNPDTFQRLLWGRVYYNATGKKFSRKNEGQRSFVHFILEPLYKIMTRAMELDGTELQATLAEQGITSDAKDFDSGLLSRMEVASKLFFGGNELTVGSVVDLIMSTFPDVQTALSKTPEQNCTTCVHITKMVLMPEHSEVFALGRVLKGTLSRGDEVLILDETYTADFPEENQSRATIDALWLPDPRNPIAVDSVPVGNWVLIGGIDSHMGKTATIVDCDSQIEQPFPPLRRINEPVFKVAIQPWRPSDLPKLLDGLRHVTKTYALLEAKVEETGEHVLTGSGEMYMDCVLHDLREVFTKVEIRVSDPSTTFSETCVESSALLCTAQTANKLNTITMLAEPLDNAITTDIENGVFDANPRVLQQRYQWDVLQAHSIWAFGPSDTSTNVLLSEVISGEHNASAEDLAQSRPHIEQGFRWAAREGPLCEEPMRHTKFRLIDTILATEGMSRGAGQLIPAARKVCYSSFLLASPRLLEPIYAFHVICSPRSVEILHKIISGRRAAIISDKPIQGTPLYYIEGKVPVVESFGLETDIRNATRGEATVALAFDSWDIVPGDPLDTTQVVKNLRPAPLEGLARDFVIKTRRRKGLSAEPTIASFVDETMMHGLREAGIID